MMVIQETRRAH